MTVFHSTAFRTPIIELEKPCIAGLSPGFWKHNIGVALELNPGSFSSPYDGAPKLTEDDINDYLDSTDFDTLEDAYEALTAKGKGSGATRLDACNQFNFAAGFQPYSD